MEVRTPRERRLCFWIWRDGSSARGSRGLWGGEWTLFVQASEWETLQQRIVRAQARWALHREALLAKEAYAARAPKLQQLW